jgi:hypothetical protein
MVVVATRGAFAGAGAESTLRIAAVCVAVFAVVGFIVGSLAESTVDDAVRAQLEQQLQDLSTGDA